MTRVIRRRFHWPTIIMTACASLTLAGGVVFVVVHTSQKAPIPAAISNQAHFPVFLPQNHISINASSYKFDPGQQVLTFTGRLSDGQEVTFAEQSTPSSFTDIPNFYDQFLRTMFEYQGFDGLQGTIHLTHPKGAGQAAVMSAKGTLIFARVAKDESKDVWLQLFNSMKVYTF